MRTLSDEDKTILTLKYSLDVANAATYIVEFYNEIHYGDFQTMVDTKHKINQLLFDNNIPVAVFYCFDSEYILTDHTYRQVCTMAEFFECIR